MSINKKFVVKYGIDVADELLIASTDLGGVGIGSTLPKANLDVANNMRGVDGLYTGILTANNDFHVGSGGTVLTVDGGTGNAGFGITNSDYKLSVVSSGNTALYVDGSVETTGELLVGRGAFGNSIPSAKLEVTNSAAGIDDNSTDGQVETIGYIKLATSNTFGTRGPTAAIGHIIKTDVWAFQYFSSQIGFFTAQNTVPGTEGALTQKAVITNEGYFGVGTTTPSAGIHVNAPASTSPAIFEINTSEAARIDNSGRLLVGTSTARAFHVGITPILQVETATGFEGLSITTNRDDGLCNVLHFGKSRSGSLSGVGTVQNSDYLGLISFEGADGTGLIRAAEIRADVDGTPGTNDMPGRLVFSTTADGELSPTEKLRITSNNYVRLASGTGGIQFNGDTAAANALDDYEEGTWTPTVGDVNAGTTNTPSTTSFTSSGVYTKVGNTVTVEGIFNIGDSGTNTTVTDRFSMAGLPYSMPNGDFGGVGTFGGRGPTSPLGLNNITFGTIQAAGGSTVMYFSFEKLLSGTTQTYDQQLSFSFSYTI
jgi:hypothetical protein